MLVFVISQLIMIRKYLDTMIPTAVDSRTDEAPALRRDGVDDYTRKD
jgi:hypothetical protein